MPVAESNAGKSTEATTVTSLVRRAQNRDRQAFDELVSRYRERIFALALHLTGNESDADDVTQEVFLKAYRVLPQFEGRSAFFTWIYRMAVNRALNARRDRARRQKTTVLGDPRLDRAIAVDSAGDPGRAAELRQSYARLLRALDRLPQSMRTTVVLISLQGLSHNEAAQIQQCSPGTIAWRVHTAREHLRRALTPANFPPAVKKTKASLSGELTCLLQQWGLPLLAPAS